MASYTMQLREYLESFSYNQNKSHRETIEFGRKKLFDFNYPIFDESYRKVFETHFIRRFYMREIGFETEGLFKFQLETWLLIHMPYFNKMFESELIKFDPLINSEKTGKHTKKNDIDQKQNTNTKGDTKTKSNDKTNTTTIDDDFTRIIESETPDSRLQLTANDGEGVIEYASKIIENTDNDKTTNNSQSSSDGSTDSEVDTKSDAKINEVEDYIEHRIGKIGTVTYSKMLQEYRQSFIRIEKTIFDEMEQLFMLVY